jgi:hypothetical protein
LPTGVLRGDDDFEQPPISYSASEPDNSVSKLQKRLTADEQKLQFDSTFGYLPALLQALQVPVDSQMLVFSKTSMQRQRISPRTPRAVYFNDNVYVGYCQSGSVLEISSADPKLGAVFYTLDQARQETPRLVRQTESCLTCHASSRTENVPGHLVRSLFADSAGEPIFSAGSYTVDHRTPLEQRWGGWYVTGTHGAQRHLGNFFARGKEPRRAVENAQGQNVTDLKDRIATDAYLSPHSDIVALMVLEHQTLVHNRLTKANFEAQAALHYQAEMNRALGKPENAPLESVDRRIRSAGDKLVEALLMVDEAPLTEPIAGTSGFAERFASTGPADAQGRSLRALDLSRRLLKYPCSYLIYSESFDKLPETIRSYVLERLREVLAGEDTSKPFAHLSTADRRAIFEILLATKANLPAGWRQNETQDAAVRVPLAGEQPVAP